MAPFIYPIHCTHCNQNFDVKIGNVRECKLEYCPSCGKTIKNPIYHEDWGQTLRVKNNDGEIVTVWNKENCEEFYEIIHL